MRYINRPRSRALSALLLACAGAFALLLAACGSGDSNEPGAEADPDPEAGQATQSTGSGAGGSLTVYSGRTESLIGPLIKRFSDQSGIKVDVRYGDTAALAATLLEEKGRSPADVYIAQDAGALGAVEKGGLFEPLNAELLGRVPTAYRSASGQWVGLSGRARVVAYNTKAVDPATLPKSILEFTDPKWKGKIGWVPTNGSFQAFVTALRVTQGEQAARSWLEGIKANNPTEYPNNNAAVAAVGSGEVQVAFVNHYYLYSFLKDQGQGFGARNHYTAPGDIGTLVNVAGAGILKSSDSKEQARRFLQYLLSEDAQRFFSEQTYEYPLVAGVPTNADVRSIEELRPVQVDLSKLEDLQGTLRLLRDVGVLK